MPDGPKKIDQAKAEQARLRFARQLADLSVQLDKVFNGPNSMPGDPTSKLRFLLLVMPTGDKEGNCLMTSNGLGDREALEALEMQAKFIGAKLESKLG